MALTHILFLCPRCGHDPMEGEKDEARCPECGLRFARGGEGRLIRVVEDGREWEVSGAVLTEAVLKRSLAALDAPLPDGDSIHSAQVLVRASGEETPVRWEGQLLGFAEAMGEPTPGTLHLTRDFLRFSRDSKGFGAGEKRFEAEKEGFPPTEWDLLSIRAVQTSSRALQFSPASGGLLEFRFPNDSPFRWENILRETLRRVYREKGLGELVEFQPRIVAE